MAVPRYNKQAIIARGQPGGYYLRFLTIANNNTSITITHMYSILPPPFGSVNSRRRSYKYNSIVRILMRQYVL